ncbi:MAG: hypothetical protein DSY33_02450 [Archaeoglobus sp.]|nr:MAG: hypothetical protein DSY33_02450 [Archaeoglobus sp.]
MQPYLPILPIIAKYPFVKATGKFLEKEYGSPSSIFESERDIERKAIEAAVSSIRSVVDKEVNSEKPFKIEQSWPILCSSCEKDCVDCEHLKNLNFRCEMCCKCFENCYQKSSEYIELKAKAKSSAVYYLCCRAILWHLSPWIRRKFAVQEARAYRQNFEFELKEGRYDVLSFLAADLGILARFGRDSCIHVSSYLKGIVKIRDEKWRLVNRKIKGGWVEITERELIRLMEEILREKLEQPAKISLPSDLLKKVESIESSAERVEVSLPIRLDCIPPCMKKILSDLQKGINIPHTARFAVTAFLLNIGMNVNSIVELFSSAPDFDEEKTRYQVEHIAGYRGKGSEYVCPSCETMRTYHNCYGDCGVSSPITYYIKKVKGVKKDEHQNRGD